MDTEQEINSQLMRPAKDISNWNFPLLEVLAKFNEFLKQRQDVNFRQAGIVVENAGNVYSRRVDSLSDKVLSWKLDDTNEKNEMEEQDKKQSTKSRKSRKIEFDLEDFEQIDFEKELGKNIDLKNRQEGKRIKLLYRQFAQLEVSRGQSSNEMIDIHGEVIGKIYDFRINQPITREGMLVKQLTPKDYIFHVPVAQDKNVAPSNVKESQLDTSEYFSEMSGDEMDNSDNKLEKEIDQTLCEVTSESCIDNDSGYCDSSYSQNESIRIYEPSNENHNEILNSQNSCELSIHDDSGIQEMSQDLESNQAHSATENEELKETANEESHEILESDTTEKINRSPEKDANEESVKDTNPEVDEAEHTTAKRRKTRGSKSICVVDENDKWEPIPFEDGVPDKQKKSRKPFKLPCHIDLLKSQPSRKRKILEEENCSSALTSFLYETELPFNKMNTHSPSRPNFTPLKKEEIEDFQKTFDAVIKQQSLPNVYDYASTIMLGFHMDFNKRDLHIDSPISCTSLDDIVLDMDTDLEMPEPPHSYTPPMTPDEFEEEPEPTPLTSKRLFGRFDQQIVQKRMKKRLGETNVRTELEKDVAKWHATIKPKLVAAEQRPPFTVSEYSSRILEELLKSREKKMPFKEVVKEKSKPEVARYFLSSLQMANTYDVNISSSGDEMELSLLGKNQR